jgi:hypothetical protein
VADLVNYKYYPVEIILFSVVVICVKRAAAVVIRVPSAKSESF